MFQVTLGTKAKQNVFFKTMTTAYNLQPDENSKKLSCNLWVSSVKSSGNSRSKKLGFQKLSNSSAIFGIFRVALAKHCSNF